MLVEMLFPSKRRYPDNSWDLLFGCPEILALDLNGLDGWVNGTIGPTKRARKALSGDKQLADNSRQVANTSDKFCVKLNVNHFKPEEILVKTDGKCVTIHGKHEERHESDGWVAREFTRRYALTDDCDADSLVSRLDPKGVLTVEANKRPKDCQQMDRIIPIDVNKVTENLDAKDADNRDINTNTTTITTSEE